MTNTRWIGILAWGVSGLVLALTVFGTLARLGNPPPGMDLASLYDDVAFAVVLCAFVIVGALIVSRQPRNTIGWLLMVPSLVFALDAAVAIQGIDVNVLPASPSFAFYVAFWLANTGWVFLIFPIILIPLLFPDGRPPSPRWNWVLAWGIAMPALFLFLATFAAGWSPEEGDRVLPNPIGFIPESLLNVVFGDVWSWALGGLTVACAAGLLARYLRAGRVEKQQIKWLLYASGFFVVVYGSGVIASGEGEGLFGLLGVLLPVAALGIPIAIGIAILRYRLFDIDVIIRRTLTYGLVTALLLIFFFGSVIVLQQVFARVTGSEQNELVTVLSTLGIAALFVPVRNRIQLVIDRRFNRKKYDAQRVLNDFGTMVRDETDLEQLTDRLLQVINETMQPRSVSMWLKPANGHGRGPTARGHE